jgi:hypothetical protein
MFEMSNNMQCVFSQWRIARWCLGDLVLNIRAAKVSILLTEKSYFYVFYRNANNMFFISNQQYVNYIFWMFWVVLIMLKYDNNVLCDLRWFEIWVWNMFGVLRYDLTCFIACCGWNLKLCFDACCGWKFKLYKLFEKMTCWTVYVA